MTARERVIICAFISLSLSIAYGYNCYLFSTWGNVDQYSVDAFKSFSTSFQEYNKKMDPAWRPRIAANYLAGSLIPSSADRHVFGMKVGLWNALWLAACFSLFIAWDRRKAIVMIFSTFACLYYGYTVMADRHIYPWDGPALLIFVLLWLGVEWNRPMFVLAVSVIGVAFKETAALGMIALLFWAGLQWKQRIAFAVTAGIACVVLKVTIDVLTQNPHVGFTMVTTANGPLVLLGVQEKGIWYSLRALTTPYLNHPIFANGGTLLIFLLLPMQDWKDRAWKAVGIAFVTGNLFFSSINEYRVFHELIPVSLWAIFRQVGLWDSPEGDSLSTATGSRIGR